MIAGILSSFVIFIGSTILCLMNLLEAYIGESWIACIVAVTWIPSAYIWCGVFIRRRAAYKAFKLLNSALEGLAPEFESSRPHLERWIEFVKERLGR